MQAWVLGAHGASTRVLSLQQRPDPVPAAGQVLIRCEGFGLNYADFMAVRGLYRDAPPPPCVLGYEVVGRVEALGSGVPGEILNKRVVAITRFGGYAELAVTDHRAVVLIDEALPLGEAAALATQGCTAWYMARMAVPLRAGQRVLVHSAAGGVGHLLVQIALRSGCTVFAVASGARKIEHLKRLGAHHVIDRTSVDHARKVHELLGDHRLDVSFNAVGGSTFRKDQGLIGDGGAQVLYGGSERGGGAGFFGTLRFVWRMGLVVPIFLMMRSKSLIGVNMLRIGEHHPELLAEAMTGVVGAHSEGWLKPHVHGVFGQNELPQALEELGRGGTLGKLVVKW